MASRGKKHRPRQKQAQTAQPQTAPQQMVQQQTAQQQTARQQMTRQQTVQQQTARQQTARQQTVQHQTAQQQTARQQTARQQTVQHQTVQQQTARQQTVQQQTAQQQTARQQTVQQQTAQQQTARQQTVQQQTAQQQTAQQQTARQQTVSAWRQMMKSLYPDLHRSTICIPPLIVNRVPYKRDTLAGQPVLVVQQPSDYSPHTPAPAHNASSLGYPVHSSALPPVVETFMSALTAGIFLKINNFVSTVGSKLTPADVTGQASLSPGDSRDPNASVSNEQSVTVTAGAAVNQSGMSTSTQPNPPTSAMCVAAAQPSSASASSAQLLQSTLTVPAGVQALTSSPNQRQNQAIPQSQTQARSVSNSQMTNQTTQQTQPQIQSNPQSSCTSQSLSTTSQSQPLSGSRTQNPAMSQSQNPPQNQAAHLMQGPSTRQPPGHSQHQPQGHPQSQPQTQPPYSMWTLDPSPHDPPKPVYASDVRADFAQQYVLTNLKALGDTGREVMFVLSQLEFTNYLKDLAGDKSTKWLPRPAALGQSFKDGDFDVLVIHRHYGILIGEIKSVGMMHDQLNKPQAERDVDISQRVQKAIKQLDKCEPLAKHLVHDIAPALVVRKTVFLPFVSKAQLLSILSADSALNQKLCASLGAADEAEATSLCLCSDQLSDPATPWTVTQANLSQLSSWWQKRMACTVDNSMTDLLYVDIVARFAGPATAVTVQCTVSPRLRLRTQGDAVSFLGDSFARLVLTPEQVDLLNRAPPRVYLKGPPGTGKTLTLALMGLKWVLQGHDVYIVSCSFETRAVSELIRHQIETTADLYLSRASSSSSSVPVGKVHMLAYDLTVNDWEEMKNMAVDFVKVVSKEGPHRFIIDEMMWGKNSYFINQWIFNPILWSVEMFLKNQYIWMAGVTNHAMSPSVEEATFTIPLRCAPPIQREVQAGLGEWAVTGAAINYNSNGIPAPSDGLALIRLVHHGPGHASQWPVDCEKCGQNIADLLRRQLNVGGPAHHGGNTTTADPRPAPLQYKDVFIVTRSSELHDDVKDDTTGKVVTPASGVVRGLRMAGVPLFVVDQASPGNIATCRQIVCGMGLASFDRVVVSYSTFLQGLERKAVVWLPGENRRVGEEAIIASSQILDRVHAVSRCTTQLVIVDLPKPSEPELD